MSTVFVGRDSGVSGRFQPCDVGLEPSFEFFDHTRLADCVYPHLARPFAGFGTSCVNTSGITVQNGIPRANLRGRHRFPAEIDIDFIDNT